MFYRHCAAKKEACIRSQANENTLYRELPRKAKKYGLNIMIMALAALMQGERGGDLLLHTLSAHLFET